MKIGAFVAEGRAAVAGVFDGELRGWFEDDLAGPGGLEQAIRQGVDLHAFAEQLSVGRVFDTAGLTFRPPVERPGKIICIGLNYASHTEETIYEQPDYPTIFARFATSLIAHESALIRPSVSDQLDFEGEMAVIIGRGGRHIAKAEALMHVAGYAVFNEGSVRDYQFKSPQWTMGKTFDGTGAFGPFLVTPDALPLGGSGLRLETRVNGVVVQSASTADMIFDVATLIAVISEAITLEPGDVIVTGTPAGIGHTRKPPIYLIPGDVCEVEIEHIGLLRNEVADESGAIVQEAAA